MATASYTATTHWAVIIGINYYPKTENNESKCLKGSVRDATTVKLFLETGETDVDTVVLTATAPTDPSSTRPLEEPEVWPTYENVISSLRRVITTAKRGDFVYIHYSGHGTRMQGDAQSSPSNALVLALVLLSKDGSGIRYLRGHVLADALRAMTEKGLVVTLVLDCCFSGGVVRSSDWRGINVRFIDYDPVFDAASLEEYHESLFGVPGTLRDASMEKDWLLNPDGYTILSACAPEEKAYELEKGGERRGALTYYLLNALSNLRDRGTELTHQSIHEHLSTKFHASWPQQTPMRYGNANSTFFGNPLLAAASTFVSMYETKDGHLHLRAGEVHGVCNGDTYAVYPFDTPEHTNDQNQKGEVHLNACVGTVRFFESEMIETIPESSRRQSQMDWKAKPLTTLSPWRVPIKLLASIGRTKQLEMVTKELRFACLFMEDQMVEPCIFNAAINEHNEYEVVDAVHNKVACVPNVPCNSKGSTEAVLNILQHLATSKYFEGVENRLFGATFEGSFSLTPQCPADNSNAFNVKHDSKWELAIENSGGGGYKIIQPKNNGVNGRQVLRLRMKVPEFLQNGGKGQCEDVVKVFITSKPTSFPLMILPEISHTAGTPFRGGDSCHGLSAFLSKLNVGFRGQGEDAWATRKFIIRTTLE